MFRTPLASAVLFEFYVALAEHKLCFRSFVGYLWDRDWANFWRTFRIHKVE